MVRDKKVGSKASASAVDGADFVDGGAGGIVGFDFLPGGGEFASDSPVAAALKKMGKKDVTTKLKALQDFSALVNDISVDILPFMALWSRCYCRLTMCGDFRIREMAQTTLSTVVGRVGREFAPNIRTVLPYWLLAQCDCNSMTATAASRGFSSVFSIDKQTQAIEMSSKSVVELVDGIILGSNPYLADKELGLDEDEAQRLDRVLAAALGALRLLLETVDQPTVVEVTDIISHILSSNQFSNQILKATDSLLITNALYKLIVVLCKTNPAIVVANAKPFLPAVFGGDTNDSEASITLANQPVILSAWSAGAAMVGLLKADLWKLPGAEKMILKKMALLLQNGPAHFPPGVDQYISALLEERLAASSQQLQAISKVATKLLDAAIAGFKKYKPLSRYQYVQTEVSDFLNAVFSCINTLLSHPDAAEICTSKLSKLVSTSLELDVDNPAAILFRDCYIRLVARHATKNAQLLLPLTSILLAFTTASTSAAAMQNLAEVVNAALVEPSCDSTVVFQDVSVSVISVVREKPSELGLEFFKRLSPSVLSTNACVVQSASSLVCGLLDSVCNSWTSLSSECRLVSLDVFSRWSPSLSAPLSSRFLELFASTNLASLDNLVKLFDRGLQLEQVFSNQSILSETKKLLTASAYFEQPRYIVRVVKALLGMNAARQELLESVERLVQKVDQALIRDGKLVALLSPISSCTLEDALSIDRAEMRMPSKQPDQLTCFSDLCYCLPKEFSLGSGLLAVHILCYSSSKPHDLDEIVSERFLSKFRDCVQEIVVAIFIGSEILTSLEKFAYATRFLAGLRRIFSETASLNNVLVQDNSVLEKQFSVTNDESESITNLTDDPSLLKSTIFSLLCMPVLPVISPTPEVEAATTIALQRTILFLRASASSSNFQFQALSNVLEVVLMESTTPYFLRWLVSGCLHSLSPLSKEILLFLIRHVIFGRKTVFAIEETLPDKAAVTLGLASVLGQLALHHASVLEATDKSPKLNQLIARVFSEAGNQIRSGSDDGLYLLANFAGPILSCRKSRRQLGFIASVSALINTKFVSDTMVPAIRRVNSIPSTLRRTVFELLACTNLCLAASSDDFDQATSDVILVWLLACLSHARADESVDSNVLLALTSCCRFAFDRYYGSSAEWTEFYQPQFLDHLVNLLVTRLRKDDDISAFNIASCIVGRIPTSMDILSQLHLTPLFCADEPYLPDEVQTVIGRLSPLFLESRNVNVHMAASSLLSTLHTPLLAGLYLSLANSLTSSTVESEGADVQRLDLEPPRVWLRLLGTMTEPVSVAIADDTWRQPNNVGLISGYLHAWFLVVRLASCLPRDVKPLMVSYLKKNPDFKAMLLNIFALAPSNPYSADPMAFETPPADLIHHASDALPVVGHMACCLMRHVLANFAPAVRLWYRNQAPDLRRYIAEYVSEYLSPKLRAAELSSVDRDSLSAEAEQNGSGSISIRVLTATGELHSTFTANDGNVRVELSIGLPPDYPLSPPLVTSSQNILNNAGKVWLRQLSVLLGCQDGASLADALMLWLRLISDKLGKLEECTICYSLVQGQSLNLPKKQCQTCKKRFHSTCLFKWFETSGNVTCPLCREQFY